MGTLKYCQGTYCHQYHSQDRLKGQKGNKTNQTRRRSNFYYGNDNFCSMQCQDDWFRKFGNRAIDHFGRLTEPKKLTEQNAWYKDYSWDSSYNDRSYVYRNRLTNEQRPLTEEQFDDNNYSLNTGE